jgi:hypothetical protein
MQTIIKLPLLVEIPHVFRKGNRFGSPETNFSQLCCLIKPEADTAMVERERS